jgi:ABC-type phosphate/phosphonate transport system substrate-binding protein
MALPPLATPAPSRPPIPIPALSGTPGQAPPTTIFPVMTVTPAEPTPPAASGPVATNASRLLTIGYNARERETALPPAYFEGLAETITNTPSAIEALREQGYEKAVAVGAEDHFDLVRRMNHGEFDLVFCSSMAFVEQTGDYAALLETRGPSDTWDPIGGVLQQGIIIARRDNPLFASGKPPADADVKAFLSKARVAYVSAHSAIGYLYPRVRLRERFGADPSHTFFCDSSEEVAKFVIDGLADAGALDPKSLRDVVAQIPGKPDWTKLVVKIEQTAPLPTDPVAIRGAMAPSRSRLGRELARVIAEYCESRKNRPIGVVDAPENAYEHVKEAFEQIVKPGAAEREAKR